ncbi:hypothetical protein EBR96_08335, partial [bacterium]|nr:hypothetical protein [bacterium]
KKMSVEKRTEMLNQIFNKAGFSSEVAQSKAALAARVVQQAGFQEVEREILAEMDTVVEAAAGHIIDLPGLPSVPAAQLKTRSAALSRELSDIDSELTRANEGTSYLDGRRATLATAMSDAGISHVVVRPGAGDGGFSVAVGTGKPDDTTPVVIPHPDDPARSVTVHVPKSAIQKDPGLLSKVNGVQGLNQLAELAAVEKVARSGFVVSESAGPRKQRVIEANAGVPADHTAVDIPIGVSGKTVKVYLANNADGSAPTVDEALKSELGALVTQQVEANTARNKGSRALAPDGEAVEFKKVVLQGPASGKVITLADRAAAVQAQAGTTALSDQEIKSLKFAIDSAKRLEAAGTHEERQAAKAVLDGLAAPAENMFRNQLNAAAAAKGKALDPEEIQTHITDLKQRFSSELSAETRTMLDHIAEGVIQNLPKGLAQIRPIDLARKSLATVDSDTDPSGFVQVRATDAGGKKVVVLVPKDSATTAAHLSDLGLTLSEEDQTRVNQRAALVDEGKMTTAHSDKVEAATQGLVQFVADLRKASTHIRQRTADEDAREVLTRMQGVSLDGFGLSAAQIKAVKAVLQSEGAEIKGNTVQNTLRPEAGEDADSKNRAV